MVDVEEGELNLGGVVTVHSSQEKNINKSPYRYLWEVAIGESNTSGHTRKKEQQIKGLENDFKAAFQRYINSPQLSTKIYLQLQSKSIREGYTHTHTHTHIYIYIYI